MSVDEDVALEKSTGVTDLPVDEFNIDLKTTGSDVSCPNGKNES